MDSKLKIGVLVSGGGSNLQAIIDACDQGLIAGEIVFVGADNPRAGGLERAKNHNIPIFMVNYGEIIQSLSDGASNLQVPDDFDEQQIRQKIFTMQRIQDENNCSFFLKTRAIAEAKLLEHMAEFSYELLVLAGYMRTLTPYFIDKVNLRPNAPRIMNIHPALLPSFPGVDGYGDTYRYGCKVAGCTVHFIDYGEDSGPIIGQTAFAIEETDTLDSIRRKGLALEWKLYPKCIQWFAQGRIKMKKRSSSAGAQASDWRWIVKILPENKSGQSG